MSSDRSAAAVQPDGTTLAEGETVLDPGRVEQLRSAQRVRYNTVTVPSLRLVGFNLLALLLLCHNMLVLQSWSPDAYIAWLVAAELYCLASWLILRRFFAHVEAVDLGFVFLTLDLVLWTAAIYVSGADASWLFITLLVRAADQTNTTFRRVLFFAHASVLCYLAMLLWIHFGQGRPIVWRTEIAKMLTLYLASIYISLTARTAESLRRRTSSALRLARAGMVAKSEFLSKMGHELRTPLSAVIGFADILLKKSRQNGDERDQLYLERIATNARVLLKTLEHILELSNIEAGKLTLSRTEVDLRTLVDRLVAEVTAEQLGPLSLKTDLPQKLAHISTDETCLYQILQHLLSNALTFTQAGGVTVRVVADGASNPVAIDIIDTGPGIPPERLFAVFNAFEQADNSTARAYAGAGLGLSLARSLAQPLGFHIEVESVVGSGSTFRVALVPPEKSGGSVAQDATALSAAGR
jgi:signal transduction histidine kinase